jgi:hypothetical protein
MAPGGGAVGRAIGVSEGVADSFGVSLFLALGFGGGVSFFLAAVFFLADFALADGDFFGVGDSSLASGVSLGFALADAFFLLRCGELSVVGVAASSDFASGVSEGFGFGFDLGDGEVFFFALFRFGVGDSSGEAD